MEIQRVWEPGGLKGAEGPGAGVLGIGGGEGLLGGGSGSLGVSGDGGCPRPVCSVDCGRTSGGSLEETAAGRGRAEWGGCRRCACSPRAELPLCSILGWAWVHVVVRGGLSRNSGSP